MPSTQTVLNAVRAAVGAGDEYTKRIPEATRENITEIGNAILSYEPLANKFVSTLVNKIGLTLIESMTFEDPFRILNRGRLPFGDTIEDIFVKTPKAENFLTAGDLQDGQSIDPYKISRPDANVGYHKVDRGEQFTRTISRIDLEKAFMNQNRFDEFMRKIVDSMYTGLEWDKYIMTREMFGSDKIYPKTGSNVNTVNVWKGTGAGATAQIDYEKTAKELMNKLANYISAAKYPNAAYNIAGVENTVPKKELILLVTEEMANSINFDYLAGVYNLEKVDLDARIIRIDNFGGQTLGQNMVAALIDRRAVKIYDTISANTTSIPNPKGYYWNYFLTYQGLISFSFWGMAVPFVSIAPTA